MSSPKTNNYLEGWHNKLKQIARKPHPNVFEIFKQEQSEQRSQKKVDLARTGLV